MDHDHKVRNAITEYQQSKGALEDARRAVPVAERAVESATAKLVKMLHAVYGTGAEVLDYPNKRVYGVGPHETLIDKHSSIALLTE